MKQPEPIAVSLPAVTRRKLACIARQRKLSPADLISRAVEGQLVEWEKKKPGPTVLAPRIRLKLKRIVRAEKLKSGNLKQSNP